MKTSEEKLVTDIAYMSKVSVKDLKKQWQAGHYRAIIQDQLETIKECLNKNINLLINAYHATSQKSKTVILKRWMP
ncbi:hypothetical protein A0H81_02612 [Grifola frondosa]|uniref:Uncharacterized protein n=1 Tax=Grifola frondosa TaxID=5627 RepID=A0A1C7MND9_GRIFR|nr:hypothetical protein A0H81_02612 [Grifola frondosa]